MDRPDAIRLAKLAAAGAAVWWVAKKATGAATAAIERAAAPRQATTAAVNGLGILTFMDRTGDWSTITGEGGLPLQLADDGSVYERLGAVLVRHDLDVNGIREALVWSGLAGSLDVDSIMREGRHSGLGGFKLKKVLKKVKTVASKVAVHKIVAKAVLGKKGEKKLRGVVKKATPYLMIAGAAAATILTAGAAAPTLIGAGAALASQVAKDVAQKRAEGAAKDAARDQAAAQRQADADLVVAQAQADGAAQGQYDAGQGVRMEEATQPDAAQPEAYKAAYRTAYAKAYGAAIGVDLPESMFVPRLPSRTDPAQQTPPNYFATPEQQAQPAQQDMPPNYFAPQAPRTVTAAQPQMRPRPTYAQRPPQYYQAPDYGQQEQQEPQGFQPAYYPPQYEDQAEEEYYDEEPAEAEVMEEGDNGDAFAEDAFIAEDDGELSGIDESDAEGGESFAEVLTDDYAEGSNYRSEDYAASGIPAPTGMEPGASSYGVF
jgi:hypothetical protein